jgi:hypothetical protein
MTTIVPITNVSQVEEAPAQSFAKNDVENNLEIEVEIQSQNDETSTESDDDSLGHSSVHVNPKTEASEADPASPPVTPAPACGCHAPSPNAMLPSGTSAPPSRSSVTGSSAPGADVGASAASSEENSNSASSPVVLPPSPPHARTRLQQGIRQPKNILMVLLGMVCLLQQENHIRYLKLCMIQIGSKQ